MAHEGEIAMGKIRVFAILAGFSVIGGALFGVGHGIPHVYANPAAAPAGGAGMGTLPPSLFDKTLPPAWEANRGQQLANIFTSCSNFQVPLQNAMTAIGSA